MPSGKKKKEKNVETEYQDILSETEFEDNGLPWENLVNEEKFKEEQMRAFNAMQEGRNVFLSGEGGTGKSFVLKYFIDSLSAEELGHTIICAPTGNAAQIIGGATLHSVFRIPIEPLGPETERPPQVVSELLQVAHRIIIDEISMVRFDVFEYVCNCIRLACRENNKNIQLIVVGDFFQLNPICKNEDRYGLNQLWGIESFTGGYAFQAPAWEKAHFEQIYLREQHRAAKDPELTKALNVIRSSESLVERQKAIEWINENSAKTPIGDAICMFPRKKDVTSKNQQEIEALIKHGARKATYNATIIGNVSVSEYFAPRELTLCKGARVMALINCTQDGYVNGSVGTVTKVKPEYVVVDFDGITAKIGPYTREFYRYEVSVDKLTGKKYLEKIVSGEYTQLPLDLAYAITIHKAQGKTLDRVNLGMGCFAQGQCYVGLSRCTTVKTLFLIGEKLKMSDVLTSPLVKDFYAGRSNHTIVPREPKEESTEEKEIAKEIARTLQELKGLLKRAGMEDLPLWGSKLMQN